MLAKIIVTGRTRESAIMRMERALAETRIEGVKTTVEFCREIMRDPGFQRGGFGVDWLPNYLAGRTPAPV
jgi:acetyl-CoA carboxylase biotin carboxylase subunit